MNIYVFIINIEETKDEKVVCMTYHVINYYL